jgi:hypothetical protein
MKLEKKSIRAPSVLSGGWKSGPNKVKKVTRDVGKKKSDFSVRVLRHKRIPLFRAHAYRALLRLLSLTDVSRMLRALPQNELRAMNQIR